MKKAVSGGGEREKGGHVLRDTTSRGLCVSVPRLSDFSRSSAVGASLPVWDWCDAF